METLWDRVSYSSMAAAYMGKKATERSKEKKARKPTAKHTFLEIWENKNASLLWNLS